jgi:hemolysin III
MWAVSIIGMLMTIFWTQGPKWIRAFFYVVISWFAILYLPEMRYSLGMTNMWLLLIGGIIYTMGALVYAFKWPNPFPRVFGYHEIFHVLIVIASGFHFRVIYNLTT